MISIFYILKQLNASLYVCLFETPVLQYYQTYQADIYLSADLGHGMVFGKKNPTDLVSGFCGYLEKSIFSHFQSQEAKIYKVCFENTGIANSVTQ